MGILNFVMRHETDAYLLYFVKKKKRAIGVKLYQLPTLFCIGRTESVIARCTVYVVRGRGLVEDVLDIRSGKVFKWQVDISMA